MSRAEVNPTARQLLSLPTAGRSQQELLEELEARTPEDLRLHWTRAFRGPPDVQEVGETAYRRFLGDNGFFTFSLPYIGDVEQDVLRMSTSLFHPCATSCATSTSGGSESVFAGLHAAREWARIHRPHTTRPESDVPYSAHPSFSKMSHYLGLRVIRTPLDESKRANVEAMGTAITDDTIGVVGSAPCWTFAQFDPIQEIAELATRHGLWMHVDACLGGYLSPFVERLGYALPPWDFRVEGVKSISADLHKFGYCPKPMSTVIWREASLLEHHFVHPADGPGGPYRMMGFVGSRAAGPVFAAWSIMQYLGQEGYLRLAATVMETKQRLVEEISAIDGLRPWDSDLVPLVVGADGLDLAAVAGEMRALGWMIFGSTDPPLLQLPVDPAADEELVETLLFDLRRATRSAASRRGSDDSLKYS